MLFMRQNQSRRRPDNRSELRSDEPQEDRSRSASRPGEIPKRGWRDILLRVKDEQTKDNLLVVAAGVAYRFCPDRGSPKWRWVSWGSVAATLLWLLGSVLFSLYVSNFGSFDQTYGAMGAVIILLMWFHLTSYIILLGGELNAEIEHRTRKDSASSIAS